MSTSTSTDKKVLAVFGATGNQGGSVISTVLSHPFLKDAWRIRALTRDPSKPAAQSLSGRGVEVVSADIDGPDAEASLAAALRGAHAVFAMTTTIYDFEHGKAREVAQGRRIADAAVAAGVPYFIYSTVAPAHEISGGALPNVVHFDSKHEVELYLKQLGRAGRMRSAFFSPGSFMQNYAGGMGPRPAGDGTYAMASIVRPDTAWPLIDVAADTGKFVGCLLAHPDRYEGKVFCAATGLYTSARVAEIMSEATGKTVAYKQLPEEVWRKFLPKGFDVPYVEMVQLVRDYGYYGKDQTELVEWAGRQVEECGFGPLTTLEQYLERCPLELA